MTNESNTSITPSFARKLVSAMKLGDDDMRHLLAAQGWLELGAWKSAHDELENITAKMRAHPDVLELYAKGENWSACVDIGNLPLSD